jgi:hypothetical protein
MSHTAVWAAHGCGLLGTASRFPSACGGGPTNKQLPSRCEGQLKNRGCDTVLRGQGYLMLQGVDMEQWWKDD